MEDELTCPACHQLFCNPVLLPCYHSLCLNCAVHAQQPAQQPNNNNNSTVNPEESSNPPAQNHCPVDSTPGEGVHGGGDPTSDTDDKLSLLSETDSGVVCTSRPSSYVGTPSLLFPPLHNPALSLACPTCRKVVFFDDNGARNLPKNRAMQTIVDKYGEARNVPLKCQLCEGEPKDAAVMCEQCEVLYCEGCREGCHPMRGPLAKHTLLAPRQAKGEMREKCKGKETRCVEHEDQTLGLYCMLCKTPLCNQCLVDGRHPSHDVQPLTGMCKAQKTELSQILQTLSEKAKGATEYIQKLKSMSETINEQCTDVEQALEVACDTLIAALHARKQQLVEFVQRERDYKLRSLKDQVGVCTHKLQQTTGLLQYCIEALKETDPSAFLQVGSALINRVANVDITWHKEMVQSPLVAYQMDLTLDEKPVVGAIEQMNFIQMKPPGSPSIIPEECSAENNSVTIAWQSQPEGFIEGYILELDDGNDGAFREVYCGKETICTVDGLHFNSMYNARVKAFNSTGEGDYSDCICLQTAEVAWFTLESLNAPPDVKFSSDSLTVSCDSFEHCVVLGTVGFSRGVHYWEFTIDRYDNNADPAFGVARFDVSKDLMLGKDDKGWSMYIDSQRSWFLHCDSHEKRTEGGIETGASVGILLDLDNHQISFYVSQEPQGPISFTGLHGVFYPAVSLNRGVTVTVHTGLDLPNDHESEVEDS